MRGHRRGHGGTEGVGLRHLQVMHGRGQEGHQRLVAGWLAD